MSEDVIYSYGDKDALEDGVLVDISSVGIEMKLGGKPVNRMTGNLLSKVCGKDKDGNYEIDKMHTMIYLAIGSAVDSEGDGYLFVGEMPGFRESDVWFVMNEVGGYTLMTPEDY